LARALHLGNTEFRIHGTNQPETIGHAVSSGCFRLDNADVIDLYDRVQVGAKVLVKQAPIRSNSAKNNPQLWTCTQITAEMRNYRSLVNGRQRVTDCCCLAEDLRLRRDRMGLGIRREARHGEPISL
jgi:L,D-transpeptidase catalytic domain